MERGLAEMLLMCPGPGVSLTCPGPEAERCWGQGVLAQGAQSPEFLFIGNWFPQVSSGLEDTNGVGFSIGWNCQSTYYVQLEKALFLSDEKSRRMRHDGSGKPKSRVPNGSRVRSKNELGCPRRGITYQPKLEWRQALDARRPAGLSKGPFLPEAGDLLWGGLGFRVHRVCRVLRVVRGQGLGFRVGRNEGRTSTKSN